MNSLCSLQRRPRGDNLKERMAGIREDYSLEANAGTTRARRSFLAVILSNPRLPGKEILGVGDDFRVGAGAQFVQVHTLPLSFRGDALRQEAI